MMVPRVLIATTMNSAGYAQHGDKMMATAGRFWASDVRLRCYAEDFQPEGRHPFVEWRDLDAEAPWLEGFKAECSGLPERCGVRGGVYDFRYDARKFSHKVAALTAAGLDLAGRSPSPSRLSMPELFCWMDADTVTHAPVDAAWLCSMVPPDHLLGWLDREKLYPECGFLAFRPTHPDFPRLMVEFRDLYARGGVFRLLEWHDSHAFQQLLRPYIKAGAKVASLSGKARTHSHPFINGPLGARLDHLKGPRKERGRSNRSDLAWPRPEDWWI